MQSKLFNKRKFDERLERNKKRRYKTSSEHRRKSEEK